VATGQDYIKLHHEHHHVHDLSNGLTAGKLLLSSTQPELHLAYPLLKNLLTHNSPTKTIGQKALAQDPVHRLHGTQEVIEHQLQEAAVDDKLGSLVSFAEDNSWSELVLKHNDPDDSIQ
jgi:hypothetical protein